ncbi:MAG: DEAD/DEAH box helicase family protein, partial [Candidatus Caenarcaniphilales bacterium]|nr:DEAD/DEAH box helicase family protein [Candidatus Caenarcaniphilales bacterium]
MRINSTSTHSDNASSKAGLQSEKFHQNTVSGSQKLLIAEILVENTYKESEKNSFSYLVPDPFANELKVGALVIVPFGKKFTRGLVFSVEERDKLEFKIFTGDFALKPINKILHPQIVSGSYLKFLNWMSEFFCCDLWTTLKGTLPISLFGTFQEKYFLPEDLKIDELKHETSFDEYKIVELFNSASAKNLSLSYIKQKVKNKNLSVSIRSLLKKGVLVKETFEKKGVKKGRKKVISSPQESRKIILNSEQSLVFAEVKKYLDAKIFKKLLIHGVTGSGKTEIYFSAAKQVLARGHRVIYLLPEISLTVQL